MAKRRKDPIWVGEYDAVAISEEWASFKAYFSCDREHCCCGECYDNYYGEDFTEVSLSRTDVIDLCKQMKIKPKDLK